MASANGVYTKQRRRIMRRDGYTCRRCGIVGREQRFEGGGFGFPTATPKVWLSIDHIIPRCRGGSSDDSNLQVLCTPCNSAKGTRMPVAA